jgi:hypothetical protein
VSRTLFALAALAALLPACKKPPKPKLATLDGVKFAFGDLDLASVEGDLKDEHGQPWVPSYSMELDVRLRLGSDPNATEICHGHGKLEPQQVLAPAHMNPDRIGMYTTDFLPCPNATIPPDYKGPIVAHVSIESSDGEATGQVVTTGLKLGRATALPELDALRAQLLDAVRALGPETVPACTAKLVEGIPPKPMEGGEASAITGGSSEWLWTSTGMFWQLESYKGHKIANPEGLLEELKQASHVVVFVVGHATKPKGGADGFEPGVFSGDAVILERSTGKPVCKIAIAAKSSSTVKFTKETRGDRELMNTAALEIDHDFEQQFRLAVARAFDAAGLKAAAPAFVPVP